MGIHSYYNQPELIASLRAEFAKEQRETSLRLQSALDIGDFKAAYLLVHTLKGNAGLINEPELATLAAEAMPLLRAGEMPEKYILDLLKARLDHVLDGIMPPKKRPITSWESVDKTEMNTIISKLKFSLENHTPECFKLLDDLRSLPQTSNLISLIESCEFSTALPELEKFKAELEGSFHEH